MMLSRCRVGKAGRTYATWSPADIGGNTVLSNSNLTATCSVSNGCARGTVSKSAGQWYWEITCGAPIPAIGIGNVSAGVATYLGSDAYSVGYFGNGPLHANETTLVSLAAYTTGDVIGIALDATAKTIAFYKNNVLQYTYTYTFTNPVFAMTGCNAAYSVTANFGASAFAYTPPSGFNAGLYL